MSVYTKRVTYVFQMNGRDYALEPHSKDGFGVEECRKNGQEDCHQFGQIVRANGVWKWTYGADSFDDYGNVSSADILAFINANPPEFDE